MSLSISLAALALASTTEGHVVFWALIGSVLGPILFYRGFQMLQYKRLIIDTPSSKIRSASMGLVELTGMPNGPKTITAPLSGQACYYYRVCAWQREQDGNRSRKQKVADESLYVPFFLADSTAEVLVDLQDADLDLHCSFKDDIGSSLIGGSSMIPPDI